MEHPAPSSTRPTSRNLPRSNEWTADWLEVCGRVHVKLGGRWFPGVTFGPDGFSTSETGGRGRTVIVSCADHDGPSAGEWVHASVSRPTSLPSYHDLTALRAAIWPDGFAYQVFAPPSRHVNIHARALHLWGRSDGANVLPDFGAQGTI